jgi:hypothetical protein
MRGMKRAVPPIWTSCLQRNFYPSIYIWLGFLGILGDAGKNGLLQKTIVHAHT